MMHWDAKWSNDMHDCCWTEAFGLILPECFLWEKKVSSQLLAFKDVDVFHQTLPPLK